MSLFDAYLQQFILEDNGPDDDEDQKNQDQDTNTDDDTQDQGGDNNGGSDDEDEFSMDGDDGDTDQGGDDDSTSGGTDSGSDVDDNDPSSKLKSLEDSIFNQLSPEQQKSKIKELKNLYDDVYDRCQTVINMVASSEKDPQHAKVYDYVVNSIVDLQKYIRDYLSSIFDSKTYIENMTELQKYLAILDTVSNVFKEIKNSIKDDDK